MGFTSCFGNAYLGDKLYLLVGPFGFLLMVFLGTPGDQRTTLSISRQLLPCLKQGLFVVHHELLMILLFPPLIFP